MKTLVPAQPGQPFQFAEEMSVFPRAAHVEGEVAVHAVGGAPHLVGQRFRRNGEGAGVGHLEDAGDAALHRGAAPGFQIFLVFGARLPQMHLAVDHAGQDVKPGAVDHFAALRPVVMADPDDAAARYGNVAETEPS